MNLDAIIKQMRSLGEQLVPLNFPRGPFQNEQDLAMLKTREITVDGYNIILHYSLADYDDHLVESVQIFSRYSPFLPFNLVVKIAKKFLGDDNLSLLEVLREGRKLYCWNVIRNSTGASVPMPKEQVSEHCVYEGFKYIYMDPSQVDYYD